MPGSWLAIQQRFIELLLCNDLETRETGAIFVFLLILRRTGYSDLFLLYHQERNFIHDFLGTRVVFWKKDVFEVRIAFAFSPFYFL